MNKKRIVVVCLTAVFSVALKMEAAAQPSMDRLPTFTLAEIIELALERNPLIVEGESLVEERRGGLLAADAYPNPTLSFHGGRGEIRDPSSGLAVIERVFQVNQPVEWPAKRAARTQAAEAGVASAQAGLDEIKLNLIADAKLMVYDLMFADQRAKLAAQNVATIEQAARVVKMRVRMGDVAPFEEVKVSVEMLKARQALAQAHSLVRTARAPLNAVTAGALGQEFSIQGDFRTWPRDVVVDDVVARALERHPTLMKLGKRREQATHRIVQQKHSRVPDLTFSSFYARDTGREAVGGGITVEIPLWYQLRGEIASAMAVKRRIEAELLESRQEIEKSVSQSIQRAQIAAEKREVYEEGLLKQAQEALRIAQVSFQHGEASLLELLDVQRVWLETLLGYAQARFDLSVALVQLERFVGDFQEL